MTNEPDVYQILRKLRYDLTAAQVKVTEALNALNAMNLPEQSPLIACPKCGAGMKTQHALALHDQNVHDGPPVPLTEQELAA